MAYNDSMDGALASTDAMREAMRWVESWRNLHPESYTQTADQFAVNDVANEYTNF